MYKEIHEAIYATQELGNGVPVGYNTSVGNE